MARVILLGIAAGLTSVALAGCTSSTPMLTMQARMLEYDLALQRMQDDPSFDITAFEREYVFPYVGPGMTFLNRVAVARYFLWRHVYRPTLDLEWRLSTVSYPSGLTLTPNARYFQNIIDLTVSGRLSPARAAQAMEELYQMERLRGGR